MTDKFIDTAVIPVAGLGTRMAPFTAGEPKFMAGVTEGNRFRPNIDYTLDDCMNAGIEHLIFIVSSGGDEHLRRYLGPLSSSVRQQYQKLGKIKELEAEEARRETYRKIDIEYIEQRTSDPYGTAVPLNLARAALRGIQHFAVTGGDDFVWHPDGASELALAVTNWRDSTSDHAIMGKLISTREEATKYGILQKDGEDRVSLIDEKPPLERIPQRPVANISRYILNGELIWNHLDAVLSEQRGIEQPEYYITDVVNKAIQAGQTFYAHTVQGFYFDAGSPQNILEASNRITEIVKQQTRF